MSTEWMGRYRQLVAALVRHSNVAQRTNSYKARITDEISLNANEWQIFEYIIEHSNDDAYMNIISEQLGVPQSTFSKTVKALCNYGLVDKYLSSTNKKNIILRPSEKGYEIYEQYSSVMATSRFDDFFDKLSGFSDKDIVQFTEAINMLNNSLQRANSTDNPRHLIKKEP